MDGALPFDVNLSILFTELPLLERFAAAREAGFDAVELWWPFDGPTPADRELDAVRRAIGDAGVRLVGLNFDAGRLPGPDRGLLSRPADAARFRANIDVAVDLAGSLGCRVLNALYGNRQEGVDDKVAEELALENLALAATAAAGIDAVVVLEALNAPESPDYPVVSSAHALRLLDRAREEAGVTNVALLCDLYHLARMGEDLVRLIRERADRFGHVQIADCPGRNQPGTGELDVDLLLTELIAAGYQGWVGLEYRPTGASADSFGWLPRERRGA